MLEFPLLIKKKKEKEKSFLLLGPKADNLSSNKALDLPAELSPFFHENSGKLHFTTLNYISNYTLNPKRSECTLSILNYNPFYTLHCTVTSSVVLDSTM